MIEKNPVLSIPKHIIHPVFHSIYTWPFPAINCLINPVPSCESISLTVPECPGVTLAHFAHCAHLSHTSKLPKTYAQARCSYCVACGSGRAKLAVTPALEKLIKEFAQPTYNSAVESFPSGCCVTCKCSIYACKKAVTMQKPVEPHQRAVWQ